EVARAQEMKALTERMLRGEVRLLLVCRANPLFSLPPSWEVQRAWQKVPLVVSFSSYPDETGVQAGLILPTHTFLESWGEYTPRKSIRGLMQPAMGPVFNTRQLGDFLLSTGKKIFGPEKFPWKDFYEYLKASWVEQEGRPGGGEGTFWEERLQEGGVWNRPAEPFSPSRPGAVKFSFSPLSPARAEQGFHFIAYPTIQFFDGRMANRPFIQELPDPMTQITWGGWVEIHPDDAKKQGIQKGDLLTLRSAYGALIAPAFPYPGVSPGVLAMPIGQGHTSFGNYAVTRSENPVQLLPADLDPAGGLIGSLSGVAVIKVGDLDPVAHVDGSPSQHGRNLAQAVSLESYQDLKARGEPPSIQMPLPSGFSKETDFYPPHPHARYRWAMVVDLDRCIGCAACVVACYAENNVPWVGKRDVLKGRKMSWLQVERYFEDSAPRVRFLPMLCQHCEIAPCESVCPVFAPQHSPEGINNQVYNRCIGTRFCSQNCPWKIRRFNWFTYPHPEPLHWQLNPDVTVRQKGVMEKCSFCIQRIVEAKVNARSQGRAVRDGEFTVACAQTCPADVLTFGNLLDPNSRISRLIRDPRAYQVLGHLQTKTAVIYLKKLTVEVKA
ncbi:MAG: 4Fe-4S dicluster domain-containing protein, partial [Deltaproteobacteria bacterium]|nr:4Fe-4S dicluster domain-containing protein [Deltaproteobacteria bacterium]